MRGAMKLKRMAPEIFVVLAILMGLVATDVGAQGAETARIQLELEEQGYYEIVVYSITESGERGAEVVRETHSFLREDETGWGVDVNPGCYAVSISVSGIGLSGLVDPSSDQPAFCLEAGETELFEPGRRLPGTSGRYVHNGEVVDPAGNRLNGAIIDFYDAPVGLTQSEVRMLDHDAIDHRGSFVTSRLSAQWNWVYATFIPSCWIQTLTAPEGYSWSAGQEVITRSVCSSNYAVMVAYPDSDPGGEHGVIELDIPSELLGIRMTATVTSADNQSLPERIDWFRIADVENPHQSRSDVPPGCYDVRFSREDGSTIWSASGRAVQTVPVCVGSGETAVVSPLGEVRTVDYDLTQPFFTGSFVDNAGAPVAGVQIDVFYPPAGLADDDLIAADHSAGDYRGTFYRAEVSDANGGFAVPIYERCFVVILTAPEDTGFESGRYHQMTRCQGDAVEPITVGSSSSGEPADSDEPVGSDDMAGVQFGGWVVNEYGEAVQGVMIDVFRPVAGVSDEELRNADHTATDYRADYTQTVVPDVEGRFTFQAESNCWVLTFVGGDQVSFTTGQYLNQTQCPGDSPFVVVSDFTKTEEGAVSGVVSGGPEIVVDLFAASADGNRSTWLGDTQTVGGAYSFEVPQGCYVTVLVAPDKYTFAATGTEWQQMSGCVDRGGNLTNLSGQLQILE